MSLNTGFNPSIVTNSIGKEKRAYNSLSIALGTTMQNKFVSYMAQNWACKEAQEFFQEFGSCMESLKSEIDKIFSSVVNTMDVNAARWAMITGDSSVYSRTSFEKSGSRVDVSVIKENIGGVRGINVGCESTAISNLSSVVQEASRAIDDAVNGVRNAGFIGGDQQERLISSLNKIKININMKTKELSQTLKKSISSTTSNYKSTATTIADAFTAK